MRRIFAITSHKRADIPKGFPKIEIRITNT